MNFRETLKDSIMYPLSDWKKILTFGILFLFTIMVTILHVFGGLKNSLALIALLIMGFVITLIINGYGFRIIKTSINDLDELPKFNKWLNMVKNGAKILVVGIVYLIPLMIFTLIFYEYFFVVTILGIFFTNPLGILESILEVLLTSFLHGKLLHLLSVKGIPLIIVLTYYVIIIPIYYVSIANMAKNDGKLRTAFNIGEILNKIRAIGFKKISIFYLLIILILIISWWRLANIVYLIFLTLIITPYLKMFISRFIGLIYKDDCPNHGKSEI